MDHQPWPELDDAALMREITQSKAILSEICGRTIDSAGLPFGRYDRRIITALKKAGYKIIYSSDGGPRLRRAMPIPRFSVRNDMALHRLADIMLTCHSFGRRAKNEAKNMLKSWR